jgi:hypothetical protein
MDYGSKMPSNTTNEQRATKVLCFALNGLDIMKKQSILFSIAATMSVELLLPAISIGHQTFLCYLPRWFRRRGN